MGRGPRRDGLTGHVAFDGASALEKAAVHPYDVDSPIGGGDAADVALSGGV
ncbi:MAG: DNA-binding response regulator, partial [Acidobacteria bacterium]|nr:DNA-binding response regulator [Acidobacteriota bacterium]